ncbi:alpha/beta hydrolase [Ktedonosporobacter rubrisoli]|uniref:Alpha/beta hydrolase n=1 Tax=Ktedonosporobacter rubrisoli TaxID=2509675 RepID=A0A4V0YYT8_KTERU|nr:alpha/beta hydrolase [Ktedonosporobacter rubrisoli]QBD77371.1 alpha/beta hydrolase [Ktedonosporobacter rubrisoli]
MSTFPPLNARSVSFADGLMVRIHEGGSGHPILVLHGGAGPQSVAGLAAALSSHAYVLLPTHPGFEGEPRPEWFDSIDDLALTYLELLERLDLQDVLVIGSSVGGWITSAMAVYNTMRLAGLVLIDAVGIQVDGHPVANASTLSPNELLALSFHNPAAFRVDPATVSPEQARARAGNIKTLYVYDQGLNMADPKLRRRLGRVSIPTLVVWGESDRIVDAGYGRAYAQTLPHASFELIPEAGHLPQLEQPERVLNLVREFAESCARV